jgi:hypothetical protein
MISPSISDRNVIPLTQKHFEHCENKIRASANEAMLSMGRGTECYGVKGNRLPFYERNDSPL